MLTRKEIEAIFRMYWDIEPFADSEIAAIEASKIAEEGYEQLSLQLYDKLEGRKREIVNDMVSYQAAMEMYHNIYYMWQGYLRGMRKKKIP